MRKCVGTPSDRGTSNPLATRRSPRSQAAVFHRAAFWALHPEQFPYYERNGGKLNGVRNAAYFALLQQIYRKRGPWALWTIAGQMSTIG